MTRSVHDLSAASSRDIHRLVTASMHGGSSLYALDEEALAAAKPDLILTQELCRVCAVSYREVNEVARAIDADITVVSLEPTSIEGILNTITTVGAMTEAEDAAIDLVEIAARAAGRGRREGPGQARCGRPVAARRRPRVARPAVRDRPLGPRADPPGRWLGAARLRRRGLDPDDLGRGVRGRSRDAPADAVRVPPPGDDRRLGGDEAPARLRGPHRRPARTGLRARRLGRTSAGRDRGSSTGSSCWPRSSIRTRSWTSRPSGRGRRSTAETSDPSAVPRDLRLPVVRHARIRVAAPTISRAGHSSARPASARRVTTGSCASAFARP